MVPINISFKSIFHGITEYFQARNSRSNHQLVSTLYIQTPRLGGGE